jgi:hypothetical protein
MPNAKISLYTAATLGLLSMPRFGGYWQIVLPKLRGSGERLSQAARRDAYTPFAKIKQLLPKPRLKAER